MGNQISYDSYLHKHACSGRNITWQYLKHHTLPSPYDSCPYAAEILKSHCCDHGTCAPFKLDKEWERYGWYDWDGLGVPFNETNGEAPKHGFSCNPIFLKGNNRAPLEGEGNGTEMRNINVGDGIMGVTKRGFGNVGSRGNARTRTLDSIQSMTKSDPTEKYISPGSDSPGSRKVSEPTSHSNKTRNRTTRPKYDSQIDFSKPDENGESKNRHQDSKSQNHKFEGPINGEKEHGVGTLPSQDQGQSVISKPNKETGQCPHNSRTHAMTGLISTTIALAILVCILLPVPFPFMFQPCHNHAPNQDRPA